jgi:phage gp16-like protein
MMSAAPTKQVHDANGRMRIKLIQMGRAQLGLDDDTYRALLARLANGKTSSSALTAQEADQVIKHMKAAGFVVKSKGEPKATMGAREDQMAKLRALWKAMVAVKAVGPRDTVEALDQAIESWAKKRMPSLTALRFATSWQMVRLIEMLKQWAERVGADVR